MIGPLETIEEATMETRVLDLVRRRRSGKRAAGRVLLVSNRLPTTASCEGHATKPSCGGLVSGLRQVARRWPAVWVGWDGAARRCDALETEVTQPFEHGSIVTLSMTEDEVARFYRRYSNGVLWPVLHGRPADIAPDTEDWEMYRAINRRYAEAVLRQLRPGDRIWVHDYHLMLLPALLRAGAPDVPIAFFLHTSFPEPEAFRTVPHREELMRGVLGADSIGFHTDAYAGNFLRTAASLGHRVQGSAVAGERLSRTHVHPMGIDVDAFEALARDSDVLDDVADIRRGHGRMLLGVDRLDYTKGIPQRLLAFEAMLEESPALQGGVSFFQVAVPSREEIPAYRDLKQVVESLVRRINARFSRPGWLPVDYLYGSLDLGSLVALYRAAEVMVVTPIRDGLNLVAKEFVATRSDGDGVLVLSRFAGAAQELDGALQVDPNKTNALAATYRTALAMPTRERRKRMRALRKAITANTVFDWAGDFLDTLDAVAPLTPRRVTRPARGRVRPSVAWAALPSAVPVS